MALKLKKDIKKSSYYVWFLGAKESKGLRGVEYIIPVIENLEEREKDVEPFKVTLQVSQKGIKIIQNVIAQNGKGKTKNETIKHFIPHNTITCVHQKEDIIAVILLLFNPVTKCPLHVHAYRCDSVDTATLLRAHLSLLIEKPENQKKFIEIENRFLGRHADDRSKLVNVNNTKNRQISSDRKSKFDSSIGSDTGTSTRESESSEESHENVRITSLYDSVAAELRAKLKKNDVPILLPPRDYDTVHRQKGNLNGIDTRRCLNTTIVGQNVQNCRRIESSGGSSGIGSDHAPSPESPEIIRERSYRAEGHSTSDDDWNIEADPGLYFVDNDMSSREEESQTSAKCENKFYNYHAEMQNRQFDPKVSRQRLEDHIRKKLIERERQNNIERVENVNRYNDDADKNYFESKQRFVDKYGAKRVEKIERPEPRPRQMKQDDIRFYTEDEVKNIKRQIYKEEKYRSGDKKDGIFARRSAQSPEISRQNETFAYDEITVSPRERFKEVKEKFRMMEKEKFDEESDKCRMDYRKYKEETPIMPVHKDRGHVKRNDSMNYDRYQFDESPVPTPRNLNSDEVRYRERDHYPVHKNDYKRRSMFNLNTEDQQKKMYNDIAKDLKRRSYIDQGSALRDSHNFSQVHPKLEHEEKYYRSMEREQKEQLSGKFLKNKAAGYRNSYVEPMPMKYRPDRKFEVLQRTNSSVGVNGRVGIASIHPY